LSSIQVKLMNFRLRAMTGEDIPEAMSLKDLAGWNQTMADWQRFLSASPDGCFAADCDGRLIGTSTTIVYEARFAWIGMVIVDPRYRGQGIGKALLERAVEYLDSRNIPCMKLDATPQGRILYEKLGFVSEYEIERWTLKREHTSAGILPVDGGKGIVQAIESVLRLDREIFGADRSELLRSLAEAAPDFTLVDGNAGRIEAYSFGRRGSLADHLGPWMARNEDVAEHLLDKFLRHSGRELVFVDCLRDNPWAVPLVQARGFEFQRPLTRMFRGTNEHPGMPELLCAALGPEFG
jgi:GNAT superfamily N-acetyltransferase